MAKSKKKLPLQVYQISSFSNFWNSFNFHKPLISPDMSKLSIMLLSVVMLISSVSLFGVNIFEEANTFNEVLDKAKTNRRLLLTYAAGPAIPCCIAMEKATFQNTEIQKILKQSFYPIKIKLSNELGKKWAEKFNIVNTPTLLFFDIQGTLIKQVENGVSSKELKLSLIHI